MTAVLETRSVAVRAGAKRLLDDVSLSFAAGETVALIGPNGAGKSTLLRVLSGEIRPRPGQVRLHARELSSYSPHELAWHRAVLSQQVHVAFPFTVAEIVRMGVNGKRSPQIDMLVDAALAELGLHDIADRAVTTLSGGEQQRVHFARVLAQLDDGRRRGASGILLLDEPTASLDLRHQLAMVEAVRRRAAEAVLTVAVFHDLNLAALAADRIVVLDRGGLYSTGRPEETITDDMLREVFSVRTKVSMPPEVRMPFVLPQAMTACAR